MRAVRFWGFLASLARLIITLGGDGFFAALFFLGAGTGSFGGAVGIFFGCAACFGCAAFFLAISSFRTGNSLLATANFRIAVASFAARPGCIRLSPKGTALVVDTLATPSPLLNPSSLSSPESPSSLSLSLSFAPFGTRVPFFGALRTTRKSIRFSNSNDHVHLPASRQSASIVQTMFWISSSRVIASSPVTTGVTCR